MVTLHLTIPPDLEQELSKLPDLEVVVIEAIRKYISSNNFLATEKDLENSTAQDIANELLTSRELNYYLAL